MRSTLGVFSLRFQSFLDDWTLHHEISKTGGGNPPADDSFGEQVPFFLLPCDILQKIPCLHWLNILDAGKALVCTCRPYFPGKERVVSP